MDRAVPFAFPNAIRSSFKQVDEAAPIFSYNVQMNIPGANNNTSKNSKKNMVFFYVTPDFFKIFDFPLISGSYESLANPNNALVTRFNSRKIFRQLEGRHRKKQSGSIIHIQCKVNGVLARYRQIQVFHEGCHFHMAPGLQIVFLHSTDFDGTSSASGC